MKKKVVAFIGIVSASVLIAASTVPTHQKNEVFNANVEALSRNDIQEGMSGTGDCWKRVHVVDNQLILVCGTCIYIRATENFLSGKDIC